MQLKQRGGGIPQLKVVIQQAAWTEDGEGDGQGGKEGE